MDVNEDLHSGCPHLPRVFSVDQRDSVRGRDLSTPCLRPVVLFSVS